MKTLNAVIRLGLLSAILMSILLLGKIHATYFGDYDLTSSNRFAWIIAYSVVAYVIAYSFGLPDQRSWSSRSKASMAASIVAAILIGTSQIVLGQISLPRFVIAISVPVLFVVFNLVSVINSKVDQTVASNERVLLISSAEDAETIQKDVDFHTEVPCLLSHHITISEALAHHDLSTLLDNEQITLIVLDNEAVRNSKIIEKYSLLNYLA